MSRGITEILKDDRSHRREMSVEIVNIVKRLLGFEPASSYHAHLLPCFEAFFTSFLLLGRKRLDIDVCGRPCQCSASLLMLDGADTCFSSCCGSYQNTHIIGSVGERFCQSIGLRHEHVAIAISISHRETIRSVELVRAVLYSREIVV